MKDSVRKRVAVMAEQKIREFSKRFGLASSISDSTNLTYQRASKQYFKEKEEARLSGQKFEFDRCRANSRMVYAAAVRRNAIERLRQIVSAKTDSEVREILFEIGFDLAQVENMLARYRGKKTHETIEKIELKDRLRVLEKIWPDWRSRLQSSMAKSKYIKCLIVQMTIGCRSEELVAGVRVEKVGRQVYELSVVTSKQRGASPDERIRVFSSTNPALEHCVGLVKLHVEHSPGAGDGENEKIQRAMAIEKAKNSYRMTISNASIRLFGISITPKAFRYSISADVRSVGGSTANVAEFLGHGSTACANMYSRKMNTRGKARAHPPTLKVARKRVESKPLSKALVAKIGQQDTSTPKF